MSNLLKAHRIHERRGSSGLAVAGLEYLLLRSSAARPATRRLYWRLAPRYYRRYYSMEVDRFEAPLDPFKVVYVSPSRITRSTRRTYPPWTDRWHSFGGVKGGDWDRREYPEIEQSYAGIPAQTYISNEFSGTILYQSMEAHFVDGVAWEDTELVRQSLAKIADGQPAWHGSSSRDEVLRRCRYLDELYATIENEGFRSQIEITDKIHSDCKGFLELLWDEILVDVGRDGELLLVDGKHRFSISKIQEIDRIPVVIFVRHEQWMEHRDELYRRNESGDHPDLGEFG